MRQKRHLSRKSWHFWLFHVCVSTISIFPARTCFFEFWILSFQHHLMPYEPLRYRRTKHSPTYLPTPLSLHLLFLINPNSTYTKRFIFLIICHPLEGMLPFYITINVAFIHRIYVLLLWWFHVLEAVNSL